MQSNTCNFEHVPMQMLGLKLPGCSFSTQVLCSFRDSDISGVKRFRDRLICFLVAVAIILTVCSCRLPILIDDNGKDIISDMHAVKQLKAFLTEGGLWVAIEKNR